MNFTRSLLVVLGVLAGCGGTAGSDGRDVQGNPGQDVLAADAPTDIAPRADVLSDVGPRDGVTEASTGDGGASDAARDGAPGDAAPDGSLSRYPIDHIVVIVKENHSFDNYFGSFPGAEGTSTARTSTGTVSVGRPPVVLTRDLCHTHDCALADWNQGAMDHWDVGDSRNASDGLAYAQYTEADVPNYWAYARRFVLADHFFSSMLGPSFPGHSFYLSAQAGWALGNPSQVTPWGCDDISGTTVDTLDHGTCTVAPVFPCFDIPTVPDLLRPRGLDWRFYGSRLPPLVGEVWSMFDAVRSIRRGPDWPARVVEESNFDRDVLDTSTELPPVVWLVNQDQNSEHPPFNVCSGENWTVGHINALMQSRYWGRVAVLILWDDFGGWYDHVPPPRQYGCDGQHPYGLGFRLPMMIVSPWARPGYVMHSVAHQGSVARFIETVFGLPSLASMDPAAQDGPGTNDLMEAFDFTQTPLAPMPLTTRSCLGQR
jgi:phospholipase C